MEVSSHICHIAAKCSYICSLINYKVFYSVEIE